MSNDTSSLQEKRLPTSESTSSWKTLLPDSLGRNNLGFQRYQIEAERSPNRQWQNGIHRTTTMAARQNLQELLHWKSYRWDRFVFLQSFKRAFSSNITHHTPSSFTTVKYYFLFPPRGQWTLSNVGFLQFKKMAILNPTNSSCGAISISSHLKPNFSGRMNKMGGHNHKFLLMLRIKPS